MKLARRHSSGHNKLADDSDVDPNDLAALSGGKHHLGTEQENSQENNS